LGQEDKIDRHGLSAAGVASNIGPVAVDAIHLDADHDESMDAMLVASALRANQDGMHLKCDSVGISAAEAGQ